jgi:hypothetical protein
MNVQQHHRPLGFAPRVSVLFGAREEPVSPSKAIWKYFYGLCILDCHHTFSGREIHEDYSEYFINAVFIVRRFILSRDGSF